MKNTFALLAVGERETAPGTSPSAVPGADPSSTVNCLRSLAAGRCRAPNRLSSLTRRSVLRG